MEILVVALDVRGQAGGETEFRGLVQPRTRQTAKQTPPEVSQYSELLQ